MAMEAQAPPFPTAGLGPRQLSCFHSTCNDNQHQCVFWSTFCNDLTAAAEDGVIKNEIKCCLRPVLELLPGGSLVQFWGLVNIGDKLYLTTCDHPFALSYFNNDYAESTIKRICEYRQHCLKYLMPTVDDADEISVDGVQQLTDGPPGRVFRSGLPEYAPDVRHYTSREYPQHNYAVGRVVTYWASPVYHPAQHLPCGVLEIVSTSAFHIHPEEMLAKLQNPLRAVNLTPTCVSLAEVSSCQNGEIAKIDGVLMVMNMIHELHDTEIWTTSGEILSSHYGKDFVRKGQGVVGKAFSSKSACFCRDVRQLSITDYPLVPKARKNQDSACFAVCLQSSCSNNFIYVLEFFLPMNENDYGDPRTLLRTLIETLNKYLQNSFEIASRRELGQKLTVEVIKVSLEDEFDFFEICNTTGIESTPMVIEVKEGEGTMQLHFSSQQVDATNASINGIHGWQRGIVGSPPTPDHVQGFVNTLDWTGARAEHCITSNPARNCIYEQQNGPVGYSTGQELVQNIVGIVHEEPIAEMNVVDPEIGGASNEKSGNEVTNMKKKKSDYTLKSSLGITRELLELNSTRNLNDAAKVLGVGRSTLKRILREYGIPRWPPRKAKEVNQAFAEQKVVEPSTKDIKEHHQSDATRLEDNSSIWVKAEYQRYKIKFRLPFSACKADLDEKVAQRFNLSIGSFKIEYQDEENDWYMIPCDEDLSTAMSTLSSVGRTEIKMRIS